MARTLEVPETVRLRAASSGQQRWLDGLPSLVAELEEQWSMRAERVLSGGSEALVATAVLSDGTDAILKVLLPREEGDPTREIEALRLADGEGCVRMLADDVGRQAMLMERLGEPLGESAIPKEQWIDVLCATAQRLWRPALGSGLPTGAEKGRWLVDFIAATWEETGRPCAEQAVSVAIDCAERRIAVHDDARSVLVHGDIHPWNALRAGDGFKLIDPDGLLAEREYDLGVIIRETGTDGRTDSGRGEAARLATRTGLDETAIWEWCVAERLATGLVCTKMGLEPFAGQMLRAAEAAAKIERD